MAYLKYRKLVITGDSAYKKTTLLRVTLGELLTIKFPSLARRNDILTK